ncbi:hypothetical protein [Cryobacterium suzukii]|nr:hypothetical protein [Cryobacterium suzukii]
MPNERMPNEAVTAAETAAAMLAPGGLRGVARRGSPMHVALCS